MINTFNPREIIEIAINIEENGRKLYQTLEDKTKKEKLKSMYKYLKEQEEIHGKVFQEMLDNIGECIVHEFNLGEFEAYLRAIASEYIFTQELIDEKIEKGFGDGLEAVEFGIFVEKESILTYSALREYVLPGKQVALDKIISEERKHLISLVALKDFLKKEG
ncbi:MAG: hypothetical protein KAS05_01760 [Candidatus Omnitrophica bacterium]|nr:hypothetical protein [Candidatus Omnitrophota bacterium]